MFDCVVVQKTTGKYEFNVRSRRVDVRGIPEVGKTRASSAVQTLPQVVSADQDCLPAPRQHQHLNSVRVHICSTSRIGPVVWRSSPPSVLHHSPGPVSACSRASGWQRLTCCDRNILVLCLVFTSVWTSAITHTFSRTLYIFIVVSLIDIRQSLFTPTLTLSINVYMSLC